METKIKINFVCHGNICRSPMAEFLFKKLVNEKGTADKFIITSSATSSEELGNPVHYGTARILDKLGVDYSKKRAVQITRGEYDSYDYFICMDNNNVRNLNRIFGGDSKNKIKLLLDFCGINRGVADPYFTGDFNATYRDISMGLDAVYQFLIK